MLFNSPAFLIFLCVTLVVYHALGPRRWRLQNLFLLVGSYFFYGWWDPRFLVLIWISTGVDFVCGQRIDASSDPAVRRRWLWVSMVTNLGILGFFKYFNFFIDSAAVALRSLGLEADPWVLAILLPPGISFYTFQTMSYTLDIHAGRMHPRRDLLSFALFVAFFPQLVAGPIERASRLLPQVEKARPAVTAQQVMSGLALILTGMFKKVAIADRVAVLADAAFASRAEDSSGLLLTGVYAFAVQIYCDFSAYSDIARGSARLLGIELMRNFEAPYLARNITDFWRRWHISLSTWLRDYLYIPLGGNRHGRFMTYRNLIATMLLGGLWHGAAWTFVVWGLLHGLYLAFHRIFCAVLDRKRVLDVGGALQWTMAIFWTVVTFHLVCLTWIFFRAESFPEAWFVLSGIVTGAGGAPTAAIVWALGATLLMDIALRAYDDHAWILRLPRFGQFLVVQLMLGGIFLGILAARGQEARPFIYFQF